jgi:ubiquinone/menaquinone biosynthesis C-methylase UbiE
MRAAAMNATEAERAKQAAIEQWTADPCGYDSDNEPGTRAHMEDLDRGMHEYAAWMEEALDYEGARGLRVLDVGCGQGIDLVRYARAGAHATGIDLTPRHAELARLHVAATGSDATVVIGDAEAMPFADGSFDRVSSNGVLHHTPDMLAALREIRRVLRPGGETRVIVYNRNSFHYWLSQVLVQGILRRQLLETGSMAGVLSRNVELTSVGARPLVRVYSPRQLRGLLRTTGFDGVRTGVRHFHAEDTPLTAWIARSSARFPSPAILDRVGRIGGWYVIGRGTR